MMQFATIMYSAAAIIIRLAGFCISCTGGVLLPSANIVDVGSGSGSSDSNDHTESKDGDDVLRRILLRLCLNVIVADIRQRWSLSA